MKNRYSEKSVANTMPSIPQGLRLLYDNTGTAGSWLQSISCLSQISSEPFCKNKLYAAGHSGDALDRLPLLSGSV